MRVFPVVLKLLLGRLEKLLDCGARKIGLKHDHSFMIGLLQLATRSIPATALVCVGKQKGDRAAATSLIASPSSFASIGGRVTFAKRRRTGDRRRGIKRRWVCRLGLSESALALTRKIGMNPRCDQVIKWPE